VQYGASYSIGIFGPTISRLRRKDRIEDDEMEDVKAKEAGWGGREGGDDVSR
jgi:hypothetical protein